MFHCDHRTSQNCWWHLLVRKTLTADEQQAFHLKVALDTIITDTDRIHLSVRAREKWLHLAAAEIKFGRKPYPLPSFPINPTPPGVVKIRKGCSRRQHLRSFHISRHSPQRIVASWEGRLCGEFYKLVSCCWFYFGEVSSVWWMLPLGWPSGFVASL